MLFLSAEPVARAIRKRFGQLVFRKRLHDSKASGSLYFVKLAAEPDVEANWGLDKVHLPST